MFIISKPKYSVTAKCLSYPGTGQRNFLSFTSYHGLHPSTIGAVIIHAIVSNIMLRLELPPTITFSGSTPRSCAKALYMMEYRQEVRSFCNQDRLLFYILYRCLRCQAFSRRYQAALSRLTSGHIQLESHCLISVKFLLQGVLFLQQLFLVHLFIKHFAVTS